jgi:type I restriction enzyme S subunit
MSAYESYIDTKLPWVSQIPSHWSLLRNKNFLQEVKETVGDAFADYTLLSLTTKGIIPRDISSGKGKFPKDFDTYKIVTSGDMAFCLFDIDETPRTVGLSAYDGMLTGAYTVFHVSGINSRFLYYYYLSLDEVKALRPLYSGLRKTIKTNVFLGAKLPVPPREEQDHIVRYLDWQVSKTNKLISALKKQIALLDELRRSITCHCVINGVDGNIKRKETEINWIDHIPEHWNVLFLSQVATEQAIKNTGLIEKNLLSLSYGRIVNKDINTAEGLLPASFEGYQIIHPGNIILRLTDLQNDHKSLRVGLSTQTGIITSAYTCLKVRDNILPEYLYLQLHSADICKVFYGMGGGVRQSIGYKDIRKMPVVVPPIEEQKLIVQKIHTLIAPFDTHIGKLNEKILHLSEYRTRLISDVVTGQIDVRDIEVPEFEYIADDVDDVSDDENTDLEEIMEEEE